MDINSRTKTFCLLGHPIEQSFSPSIHNYLFNKYKKNCIYMCFDVNQKVLEEAINGIKSLNISGFNITIPHKVDIIKHLDEIDINARLIGAVNTVKNEGGILKGYNTDGKGFVKSILENGHSVSGKKVMIIGAGGSSRSIAVYLASSNVKTIEIRNRSIEKAREISNIINNNFKTKVTYSNKNIDTSDLKDIDILINTTPIGMGTDECPIDENIKPNKELLVCDIVYKPHDTAFIKWAKKNNLNIIYGIEMLINQALEAFYIWTGINPTIDDKNDIRKIYDDSIK